MSKREPPVIDVQPTRMRRRTPWGVIGVILVMVGIGLYVAWPAIDGGFTTPEFTQASDNANLAKSALNARDRKPSPPLDDGSAPPPPEVPVADGTARQAQADPTVVTPENSESVQSPLVENAPVVSAAVSSPDAAQLAALEQDLAALVARLEGLEASAVGSAPDDGLSDSALTDYAMRLEALEQRSAADVGSGAEAENVMVLGQRIDELEVAQAAQGSQEELDAYREQAAAAHRLVLAFNTRVADLESQLQTRAAAARQFVQQSVSAGRLIVTARSGEGYAVQLAALRESARDDAPVLAKLDALQAYARSGVPTQARLRSVFPSVARDIARAVNAAHDDGWVSETVAELKRIVTVRRVSGDVPPDSVDARLMTAERALVAGDLQAAVAALAPYEEVGGPAVVEWLDGARTRLDVDQTIAQLETLLLTRAGVALNGVDE